MFSLNSDGFDLFIARLSVTSVVLSPMPPRDLHPIGACKIGLHLAYCKSDLRSLNMCCALDCFKSFIVLPSFNPFEPDFHGIEEILDHDQQGVLV